MVRFVREGSNPMVRLTLAAVLVTFAPVPALAQSPGASRSAVAPGQTTVDTAVPLTGTIGRGDDRPLLRDTPIQDLTAPSLNSGSGAGSPGGAGLGTGGGNGSAGAVGAGRTDDGGIGR